MSNTNTVLFQIHLAIGDLSGMGTAPQMIIRGQLRILHAAVHTKCNTKEFRLTGKQYIMQTNGKIFNKTFLIRHSYKPLSSSPTLLYLPSNLLSSKLKLEDISLLDPITKLPLSKSLD